MPEGHQGATVEYRKAFRNLFENADALRDATSVFNVRVLWSLLGPAVRGMILQQGKAAGASRVSGTLTSHFDWTYTRDHAEFAKLYAAAKRSQWNAETDLDWSIDIDPYDPDRELVLESYLALPEIPAYRALSDKEKATQRHAFLAWMISQFLHGEQGALFAACQVTSSVEWTDGKLYGSTQVVDEGRHVEVFHRYLTQKLQKTYPINDNTYTILDALMSDGRWDLKFLGMQILVEGLALSAFGTLRKATREPLLKELLKYVITDEARHVHYGVVALREYYTKELPESERRDREDWAYEVSLMMRNRFFVHEFYDEFYAHVMSKAEWNRFMLESEYMKVFRRGLFRRIIPNLKRINLLSDRIRPHYEAIGLLQYEHEPAAPELSAPDLLEG